MRNKEVADTPEEKVRQWFIGVLLAEAGVPATLMMSEVLLNSIPGSNGNVMQWRSDIVIYDRNAKPVGIVECKRPEVPLDREVLEQGLRYCGMLGVKYLFITNGTSTRICLRRRDNCTFLDHLPSYEEMISEDDDQN